MLHSTFVLDFVAVGVYLLIVLQHERLEHAKAVEHEDLAADGSPVETTVQHLGLILLNLRADKLIVPALRLANAVLAVHAHE